MNCSEKLATGLIVLVLFVSAAAAYTGTGNTGSGSNDDTFNIYCEYNIDSGECDEPPEEWPDPPECADGVDNNGLFGSDYDEEMWNGDTTYAGDPGCSSSYDDTENVLWDTDLTATVNDLSGGTPSLSEDPTVYFAGEIKAGVDIGDAKDFSRSDSASGTTLVERSLRTSASEAGDGKYTSTGLGGAISNSEISVSSFPEGTIVKSSGRIVDPPVAPSQVSGGDFVGGSDAAVTCGDGELNDGYDSFNTINPSAVPGSYSMDSGCYADYGGLRVFDQYSPTYDTHNSQEFSSTNGECPGDDSAGTDGEVTPDAGTMWYEAQGDEIVGHYWSEDTYSTDCGSDGNENIKQISTYTKESSTVRDCSDYDTRLGGGDIEEAVNYAGKPDNDQAGTFTSVTAHGDDSDPEIWCQFDETLTVDADGPQGGGDGFVVIDNDGGVVGSLSPLGGGQVGKRVFTKSNGGSLTRDGRNFLGITRGSQWSASCPTTNGNTPEYCIKYLDFYTAGGGSGWSSVSQAVKVRTFSMNGKSAITPDQSYSACKFINMINERENGDDRELIDCDYEANRGVPGDMSPLTQACGDQTTEDLVAVEGKQANFNVFSQVLFQSQSCVDYGENGQKDAAMVDDPDTGNVRTLTSSACVLGGLAYAEGTVKDVSTYGAGSELGGNSPDYEVCLNPDIDSADNVKWDNRRNTGINNQDRDVGGEWYDLDDEEVQEYVQNNFDASDYDSNLNRLETFMRTNPNPQNPEYNPTGESTGVAMEDDCGSERFDTSLKCEDEVGSTDSSENLFYTFFDVVIQ